MKKDIICKDTEHEQYECFGRNTITNNIFYFYCDKKLVNILRDLNTAGVETLSSCQEGNEGGILGQYIVFKNRGAKRTRTAFEIIKKHWAKYWIKTEVNPDSGDIVVRAFTSRKNRAKLVEICGLRID